MVGVAFGLFFFSPPLWTCGADRASARSSPFVQKGGNQPDTVRETVIIDDNPNIVWLGRETLK